MGHQRWHGCGHAIWTEYKWTGFRNAPFYHDGEEESATAGQEVTHCPCCGECLSEDVLLNQPPETEPPPEAEEPAPKPIADVLAEALKTLWDGRFTDGGVGRDACERPGYTIWLTPEQCEIVEAALARHAKEQTDAQV